MKATLLLLALLATPAFGASQKILNKDVASNAAIAHSKMAALTVGRVMLTDGSGFASASSVTGTTLGYLDATSSIQTQLDAKQALDADLTALAALSGTNTIYYRSAANTWTAVTVGSGLDFTGGTLSATGGGGSGDVTGPASSTDNAIARFDSTTGKIIQNSGATIDDSGNITANSLVGNASTASALAANGTNCSANQFNKGVDASGNAESCAALVSADLPAPSAAAISASDIDWSSQLKIGGPYTKTLSANTTFTFSNTAAGSISVRLTNTASNYTVTWPTVTWLTEGGVAPTMSVGANSDVYTFISDGSTIYGIPAQQTPVGSGSVTEYSWKGNHDTTCSFARSTASLGDPAADASCGFNQVRNVNFGTVSSYVSGSDKLPGLNFSCPATGRFFVRASFNNTQGGSATNYVFDLYDGSTTVDTQRAFIPTGATGTRNDQLEGIYECTAAATVNLRIRTESSDGASAFTITGNSPVNAVEWSIFKIN